MPSLPFKKYKKRCSHEKGGDLLADLSLLDWMQLYNWTEHTVRILGETRESHGQFTTSLGASLTS